MDLRAHPLHPAQSTTRPLAKSAAVLGLLALLPLALACNSSKDGNRKGPGRSGTEQGRNIEETGDGGLSETKGPKRRGKGNGNGKGGRTHAADGTKTKARGNGNGTEPAATTTPGAVGADGCCIYCLDETQPCGDSCSVGGDTCTATTGCACAGSARPERMFKKGDLASSGMIREDVVSFNRAQGDPVDGDFTLTMAFEGAPELADATAGKLHAVFETSMGSFSCELFDAEAPLTVANFVGLARGVRPSYDSKSKEWRKLPYFDNIVFHRVIERFMVQGGDPAGTGMGTPGFFIPDEFNAKRRHDSAGILSMANRNPIDRRTQQLNKDPLTGRTLGNTGSAQFFITVTETRQLDDRHTVFGKCEPAVPLEISKVPVTTNAELRYDHRPKDDVVLKAIKFERRP